MHEKEEAGKNLTGFCAVLARFDVALSYVRTAEKFKWTDLTTLKETIKVNIVSDFMKKLFCVVNICNLS